MTFPMIYSFINIFKSCGIRAMVKSFKITLQRTGRRKKIFWISGYGYDWMHILEDLVKKDYSFLFTHYYRTQRPSANIKIPVQLIKNVCIHRNIDFSGIMLTRLNIILEKSLADADEYLPYIKKILKTYKPCAVLCSTKSNFAEHILPHIAQKDGIPVISWQHGAAGFFKYPLLKYIEIDDSNMYLVWGSGVKEEVEREFHGLRCKILPVGSFFLQNEYTYRSDKKTNRILYVTTNYFHNSLYVGYAHNIQDIEFWETQKEIINVLGSFSCDTVLKLHPGYYQHTHFAEYVKDKQYNHIKIVKNEPAFPFLLHNSDIIIIDFPSTTLLQAIASRKTVFVLLKHLTLTAKAQQLLKKRAFCSENLEEFLEMIVAYLNRKNLEQKPDVNNSEFLEEYGIAFKTGDVSERVTNILDDACR